MAIVDETGSSGRKVDAVETINPQADCDINGVKSSAAADPYAISVAGGFYQVPFRLHHLQNSDSSSSFSASSSLGKTQLQGSAGAHFRNVVITERQNEAGDTGYMREMRNLEDFLSKLNPMAEEFVPSFSGHGVDWRCSSGFVFQNGRAGAKANLSTRKKSNYIQEKQRLKNRTTLAQREEVIRRTVYVSDLDQQVTEEQLATLFINCGQVIDCRVCGDPNSVLHFAFIEFTDEDGARAALNLSGTMLGYYPVKVLPSKTAIAPVNPIFLPRSEDEREMCARTVYCTNIDRKVTHLELKLFFESICGQVYRLRLLGDCHHPTLISFVEFVQAGSAIAALNCSGAIIGSMPIRVSPSKTPVRPRPPRHSVPRV